MMTDPIADMLTRIRNASMVHKKEVVVPFSKIKMAIATILVREGYLGKAEMKEDRHPFMVITLKYDNGEPVIQHIKRLSSPGEGLRRRALEAEGVVEQPLLRQARDPSEDDAHPHDIEALVLQGARRPLVKRAFDGGDLLQEVAHATASVSSYIG
jgi:small subunit ribosomal protein S8